MNDINEKCSGRKERVMESSEVYSEPELEAAVKMLSLYTFLYKDSFHKYHKRHKSLKNKKFFYNILGSLFVIWSFFWKR